MKPFLRFFMDVLPDRIQPPRERHYTACPKCGQIAWDAGSCSACHHYAEIPESDPAANARQFQAILERWKQQDPHRCEGCDEREAEVTAEYPLYDDFTGERLAATSVDLCTVCFKQRHPDGKTDSVFGEAETVVPYDRAQGEQDRLRSIETMQRMRDNALREA